MRFHFFLSVFIFWVVSASASAADYKVPGGYDAHLKGIDFSAAQPVDDDYLAQFKKCDEENIFRGEEMTGNRRCLKGEKNSDPNNAKGLIRFPNGAVMFEAKMAVDVDGGYRPCAGSSKGPTNQCRTSFIFDQARGWSECKREKNRRKAYANADTLPYVVIPADSDKYKANPREFSDLTGIEIGDVGVIVYKNKLVPVLVADGGPHNKLGEGSLAAFDEIGVSRCAKRVSGRGHYCAQEIDSSLDKPVLYFLFPNSSIPGLTPETINGKVREKALSLFKSLKN